MSHQDMAAKLYAILEQSNLQVPVRAVEEMSEIKAWLRALAEGQFEITSKKEQEH